MVLNERMKLLYTTVWVLLLVGMLVGLGGFIMKATHFNSAVDSVFNQSLTGAVDTSISFSTADECSVAYVVNGSVDAYAVDPVQFSFSASSTPFSVAQCILWTNLTGSWASNESNDVFFPSTDGNFNLTLEISNKAYVWGVFCNDTSGVGEYSSNNTLLMTQGVLQ